MPPWWACDSLLRINIQVWAVSEPLDPTALHPPHPPLSMFLLMTRKDNCRVLIWCPQFVNNILGLCCSDTAFSIAIWYGNVLYVYAHIHIFISKEQQQMYETSPAFWKNGSLLLNVDSATLPPSGTCAQCRWVFHNHNLQAVDFQSWGDIDRLHICSNKICRFNFIQAFFWHTTNLSFCLDYSLVVEIEG